MALLHDRRPILVNISVSPSRALRIWIIEPPGIFGSKAPANAFFQRPDESKRRIAGYV
jgi:hypothetical protein